jgi:tetratricopeptide (TPR) repeat protein
VVRFRFNVFAAQTYLADLHWYAGRRAEARTAYGRVASLAGEFNSADSKSQASLAWFLATCPDPQFRDPGRAVELAKKAVNSLPSDPVSWCTLGVAYYRAGNWQASVEALGESIKRRNHRDNTDLFFLAMALWQRGDRAEADRYYAQAVKSMGKTDDRDMEVRRFRAEAEALMTKGQPEPK